MVNFSNELLIEAETYLKKKMGSMPSRETVNEFLNDMARLGELFQKNAKQILNQKTE